VKETIVEEVEAEAEAAAEEDLTDEDQDRANSLFVPLTYTSL
jgi:hypothetical protein